MLAPLLWAVSNLIDERLVRGTSFLPWTIVTITGSFASTPVVLLPREWSWPGWSTVALAVVTGALSVLVYFPYFVALGKESAARVVLMWNLSPVLVLGLATAFLREQTAPLASVAVVLLVTSSIVAGFSGICPDRYTVLPARIAWL